MRLLLAHQGGWDEALLFAAPIALAYLAIRTLDRKAKRARPEGDEESSPAEEPSLHEDAVSQNGTP